MRRPHTQRDRVGSCDRERSLRPTYRPRHSTLPYETRRPGARARAAHAFDWTNPRLAAPHAHDQARLVLHDHMTRTYRHERDLRCRALVLFHITCAWCRERTRDTSRTNLLLTSQRLHVGTSHEPNGFQARVGVIRARSRTHVRRSPHPTLRVWAHENTELFRFRFGGTLAMLGVVVPAHVNGTPYMIT